MNLKDIERDARLFATPLAQQISAKANEKPPEETAAFAGTTASLVHQTIVVSLLLSIFPPGSFAGEAQIAALYDKAKRDAIERWHKSDLKERGYGPTGRG